jgi:hypothetical protein
MKVSIQSMGGLARAKKLSPAARRRMASVAARARWADAKRPDEVTIPLSVGFAKIPFPMSKDDFEMLTHTLEIWELRLVKDSTKNVGLEEFLARKAAE